MRPRTCWILILFLAVGTTAPAMAQTWKGTGRVSGVVTDTEGLPIEGAEVRLVWGRDATKGPEPMVTDDRGRWAALGLLAGSWTLQVAAEGYQPAEESVTIKSSGGAPISTTLTRAPMGEGLREKVAGWVESGNTLLAEKKPAEARAEYMKAVEVLSGDGKAEVLMAVARAFFLEQKYAEAISALERGVVASPQHEGALELYNALMEAVDRVDQGKEFLRKVEAGEITALDVEPAATAPAAEADGGS